MKTITKKHLSIILIIAMLMTCCMLTFNHTPKVYANAANVESLYFTGRGNNLSPEGRDLATKNSGFSSTAPTVTVLTHGLGGSAKDWSNENKKFVYDSTSLIEQLRQNNQNTKVYSAKVAENTQKFWLSEQRTNDYMIKKEEDIFKNRTKTILSPEDATKHLIIVFQGSGQNVMADDNTAYAELHMVIDYLLYDLQMLGIANPRINLIGHSRGGILNMMYTYNHPFNVDSVYSMGTPYNGSATSNLLANIADVANQEQRDRLFNDKKLESIFSTVFIKNSIGENERRFTPSSILNHKSKWNNAIALNPQIKANAIAGITDTTFWNKLTDVMTEGLKFKDEQFEDNATTQEMLDALLKYKQLIEEQSNLNIDNLELFVNMFKNIKNFVYSFDKFKEFLMSVMEQNEYEEINSLISVMKNSKNMLDKLYNAKSISELYMMIYDESTEDLLNEFDKTVESPISKATLEKMDLCYQNYLREGVEIKFIDYIIQNSPLADEYYSSLIEKNEITNKTKSQFYNEIWSSLCPVDEDNTLVNAFLSLAGFTRNSFAFGYRLNENGNMIKNESSVMALPGVKDTIFEMLDIQNVSFLGVNFEAIIEEYEKSNFDDGVLPLFNTYFEGTVAEVRGMLLNAINQMKEGLKELKTMEDLVKLAPIIPIIMKALPIVKGVLNISIVFSAIQFPNLILKLGIASASFGIIAEILGNKLEVVGSVQDFLKDFKLKSSTSYATSFWDRFAFWNDELFFFSDLFVDYDSQIATGYNNFEVFTKLFTENDVNINKVSNADLPIPIPHNLETRNLEIISHITSTIDIGSTSFYRIRVLDEKNKTAELTGVSSAFSPSSTLVLPEFVNDYKITSIGYNVFENLSSKNVITSIELPADTDNIEAYAFYNLENLVNITNTANLRIIGDYAFLKTKISSFNIGAKLQFISLTAFRGLNNISFNASSDNFNYSSANGSLFNYDKTILYRYGGTESSYTLPNATREIYDFAFENSSILTVNLNNIEKIHNYAFQNSTLSNINYGNNKVNYVGTDVINGTSVLENLQPDSNGFKYIFNTIIGYEGNATQITEEMFNSLPQTIKGIGANAFYGSDITSVQIPKRITSIGEYAFAYCENLTEIIFHDKVETVEGYAFKGCINLNSVKFYKLNPPVLGIGIFDGIGTEFTIYVPELTRESYQEYWSLVRYLALVNSFNITISYDVDGEILYSEESVYYGVLNNMPTPSKNGYVFDGWNKSLDTTSTLFYANGNICDLDNNSVLYARWRPAEYQISFDSNGGISVGGIEISYLDQIGELPTPTRSGYTFDGWYLNNLLISSDYVWNFYVNKTLTAKWIANNYNLNFDVNGGESLIPNYKVATYDAVIGTLPITVKSGYSFSGWKDLNGSIWNSSVVYDFAQNTTLTAQWTIINYTLSYSLNGGIAVGNPLSYNIESNTIILQNPTRDGYTLGGWYGNVAFSGQPITQILSGSTENKTFFAKWNPIVSTVSLSKSAEDAVLGQTSQNIAFDSAFDLPVPQMMGYEFLGWHDTNGIKYTNGAGNSIRNWNKVENTTLIAEWQLERYSLKLSNGTISKFIGVSGISETQQTFNYGDTFNFSQFIDNIKSSLGDLGAAKSEIENLLQFWFKKGHKIASILKNGVAFGWTGNLVPDLGDNDSIIEIDINWTKEYHTIKVYSDLVDSTLANNLLQTINAYYDEPINLTIPTRTGYTFKGFVKTIDGLFTEITATEPFTYTRMPDLSSFLLLNNSIEIAGTWQANTYTLSFNPTGGSVNTTSIQATYDSIIITLLSPFPTPIKAGYTFKEWNTIENGSGGKYELYHVYKKDSDSTAFAQWTVNQYTLSFNTNGGGSVPFIKQNFGSAVAAPISPAKDNYDFVGWYIDTELTQVYNFTTMPASNLTLYAKWIPKTYTLFFNSNGGTDVSSITQSFGSSITAPSVPTKNYYNFVGWYSDEALTTAFIFNTMPSSRTLYAKWNGKSYNINYTLNGGTNSTSNTATYTFGSSKKLFASVKKYYQFDYWQLTHNGMVYNIVDKGVLPNGINGNISLFAFWKGVAFNHTASATYNMTDFVSIVTVNNSLSMTYNIKSTVNEITFIGGSSSTLYKNFFINIESRTTSLKMRFVNIKIEGKTNSHLINAQNCPNLIIDVEGNVALSGGSITNGFITGWEYVGMLMSYDEKRYKEMTEFLMNGGYSVIKANDLTLSNEYNSNSNLTIKAGNGSGTFENLLGVSGGNGLAIFGNLTSLIKTVTITGGNGAVGANGLHGSNKSDKPGKAAKGKVGAKGFEGEWGDSGIHGGFGGLGLGVLGDLSVSAGCALTSTGGNGGRGGNGGNGGCGGIGGEGGDGVLFGATAKQGGDSGDGGNGGSGGYNGPNGYNFINGTKSGNSTLKNGSNGSVGIGGSGGSSGPSGGLGGMKTNNKRAATGGIGNAGSKGIDGHIISFNI